MFSKYKKGIKSIALITFVMILISLIISIIYFFINFNDSKKHIKDLTYTELEFANKTAQSIIDSDYHERIKNGEVGETEYISYVKEFNKICIENDLEYLWSVIKDENGDVRFTTATSTDKINNKGHAQFYSVHDNPEAYIPIFQSMEPSCDVISDEWGDITALIVPVQDERGNVFLVGASKTTESVHNLMLQNLRKSVVVWLVIFVICIIASIVLANVINRPINEIVKAMGVIESGKYDQLIEEKGTFEHRKMVQHFNTMINAISNQIQYTNTISNHLDITLNSIADGVITTNEYGKITRLNREAERLTGWSSEQAFNRNVDDVFFIIDENTKERHTGIIKKLLKEKSSLDIGFNSLLILKNKKMCPITSNIAPIKDDLGNIDGVVIVFRDNTDIKNKINEITFLSYHDVLTGLYNRLYFEKKVKELSDPQYYPLSVVMGDVNGLKLINDVFGHVQGDMILKSAANILKLYADKKDIVARCGGDEFWILMPNTTHSQCMKKCSNISSSELTIENISVTSTVSIGCSTLNKQSDNINKTLKKAEEIMYHNKLKDKKVLRNNIIQSTEQTFIKKGYHTKNHIQNLIYMCKVFASEVGLAKSDTDRLILLARIHDIGKAVIDDSILLKPNKLNDDEWNIIKTHSEAGYRIAKSISGLVYVADGILYHHERYDGKGYPNGLSGESIPKISRIIAIVDSFDIMMNKQIYKKAMSKKEAIEELKICSGKQFDPKYVEIYIDILNSDLSIY